jgi:hypothetical protein
MVGELESSHLASERAGECAFLPAEQLALDQRPRESRHS